MINFIRSKQNLYLVEKILVGYSMNKTSALIVTSVVLLLVIVAFLFYKFFVTPQPTVIKQGYMRATVPILTGVDERGITILSGDPDFKFAKVDMNGGYQIIKIDLRNDVFSQIWAHTTTGNYTFAILNYVDPLNLLPWFNQNGFYYRGAPPGDPSRKGVVVFHPLTVNVGSYIAQNMVLPSKPVLVARVANLADWIDPCKTSCSDSIVRIKITDRSTYNEETVYENVLNSKDGWKTVALDLSKYANKDVAFKVEGYAGGPCSQWCQEWTAVDYFGVGQLS